MIILNMPVVTDIAYNELISISNMKFVILYTIYFLYIELSVLYHVKRDFFLENNECPELF